MMLDAFNVPPLRFRIQTEQRKKSRQRFVAALDLARDVTSLVREDHSAIFFRNT